ncbi:MAG: hypothetical protein JXA54_02845 [Candidatus Heimdallarchaeota archaeon]|nr:hypothetical protein [Candidatus Heimdallarchaeota archaeon]
MSHKEEIPANIQEKYENAINDEVKFGIITALQFYEPLNLKKLSQLVGRPETTTIRYLKQLLAEELIDVDAETTATSWGKFYKLSKFVKKITNRKQEEQESREIEVLKELLNYREKTEEETRELFIREILTKENLSKLQLDIKNRMNLLHNIQNMIINDFSVALNDLDELIKKKGKDYLKKNLVIDPADILLTTDSIQFSKSKHLVKFYEMFAKFQIELTEFKRNLREELLKEKIPDNEKQTMNLHIFMGTNEFKYYLKDQEK